MKVLGVTIKEGEYQGRAYKNVMLHCSYEDQNALGVLTEVVKVKHSSVKEVFGKEMDSKDYQNLIGKQINAYYNRFGVVSEIKVLV